MSDVTNTVIKAIENSRENRFEHVLIDVAKAFAFCGFFQFKNWSKIVESTFDANNLAVNTSNTEQASANEGNDALLLFNSQLAEFLQDDWNEMLPNIEAFDLNLLSDIEMELDRFEENFNELHTPHKSNTASNEIFVLPRVHVGDPQILATPVNDEASPQHIPIYTGQMYLNSPVDNQRFSDTSTLNRQYEKPPTHSENNVETTGLIETSISNVEFLNELQSEIVNQQLLMDEVPQNTNLMPPIRRISSAEDLLAELLSLSSDDDTLTSFTDETNRIYGQHNSDISAETTSLSDKHEQHYRCESQNLDSQLTTKQVEQTGERVLSLPLSNQALSQHAVRKSKEQLRQRLKIHSNEQSYVCDICQNAFQSGSILAIHKRFHTNSQISHVCDICEKSFGRASSLSRHKRIHTGHKPHACDVCQKSFAQSSDLSRHKLIHTGQRPYVCDVCQKSFGDSSSLARHKLIHTGQKPHACDVCQKSFARSTYLSRHNLIHTGQRPYVCDVCQKSFGDSSSLARHKLIHTGQKPHACDVCQKLFAHSSSLLRHKMIHTGQKPHACDVCQKPFRHLSALSKHQRTQHGEHFSCAHCGQSFSQKADIEFHLVQCFKEHNRRRKG